MTKINENIEAEIFRILALNAIGNQRLMKIYYACIRALIKYDISIPVKEKIIILDNNKKFYIKLAKAMQSDEYITDNFILKSNMFFEEDIYHFN